ncbi:hypothetical protein PIB30_077211, partial [Stylosanthes scabra]|nr:hypothetical protein [Stylosanthes scabra]
YGLRRSNRVPFLGTGYSISQFVATDQVSVLSDLCPILHVIRENQAETRAKWTESPRYTWDSHVIRGELRQIIQTWQQPHVIRGKSGVIRGIKASKFTIQQKAHVIGELSYIIRGSQIHKANLDRASTLYVEDHTLN